MQMLPTLSLDAQNYNASKNSRGKRSNLTFRKTKTRASIFFLCLVMGGIQWAIQSVTDVNNNLSEVQPG